MGGVGKEMTETARKKKERGREMGGKGEEYAYCCPGELYALKRDKCLK